MTSDYARDIVVGVTGNQTRESETHMSAKIAAKNGEQQTKTGPLSAEEKKMVAALFKDYDLTNKKLDEAREAVEAAMSERSHIVERLAKIRRGYKRGGKDLKVMSKFGNGPDGKPDKTGANGVTWFFRGEREFIAPEVD